MEETGAGAADVIRAYVVVRDVYGLRDAVAAPSRRWTTRSPTEAQTAVYLETRRLLDRAVRWLVTNRRSPIDVPGEIARLRPGVARAAAAAGRRCSAAASARRCTRTRRRAGRARACRRELAELATRIMYGFGLLDIVEIAHATGRDVDEVADGLLRAVGAVPGRRPAVEDLRAAARGPLADAGPDGAALRPVRGAGRR